MAPKHEVVVKGLQKQCDEQAAAARQAEAEARDWIAEADKEEKYKNDFAQKLRERQSLLEKFKTEMANAKSILEADHGDPDVEEIKAEQEANALIQSADKIFSEIEKVRGQRAATKKASQQKVAVKENQAKDHEAQANKIAPSVELSAKFLEFGRQECLKKTTPYAKIHEVREDVAAKLKKVRDELDSHVQQRQEALDKKEDLELEDARGVVEAELLAKQNVKLKQLVIDHGENLEVAKEDIVQRTKERDAIIQKTEEVKLEIARLQEQINDARKVALEKRDVCKAADKELDEATAAARRTSTLLKHALQDVEEQNEDLRQCEADIKELRGNHGGTRSALHDARAAQELAEEKEQLVKSRLAQRIDDLLRVQRERDALNDFADGYLRDINQTVVVKSESLTGELAKHATTWSTNRTPVTRLPLFGAAGTGESSDAGPSPKSSCMSPRAILTPQEAGTQEVRNRFLQHKDPAKITATQRAALMCLEKPLRSPNAATKITDESTGGTNGLSNKALVGNLVANAMSTPRAPLTSS